MIALALAASGHVLGPVSLLTWVVAVARVPAAVEHGFFAAVGAPLLLFCLQNRVRFLLILIKLNYTINYVLLIKLYSFY